MSNTLEITAQATTFPQSTPTEGSRNLKTEIIVESTRTDGRYVALEVSTTHRPGQGYSASIQRASIDGISRTLSIGFGVTSDMTRLELEQPASIRFNRNTLAKFHSTAVQHVEANIHSWLTWASDCKAHTR